MMGMLPNTIQFTSLAHTSANLDARATAIMALIYGELTTPSLISALDGVMMTGTLKDALELAAMNAPETILAAVSL